MGVEVFHNEIDTAEPLTGNVVVDAETFSYEVFLMPIVHSAGQESIIERLGTRMYKGVHCLGITKDIVREHIREGNYSAIVFVKRDASRDTASATLQYYNWLTSSSTGEKQMWVNDLCRQKDPEKTGRVSPVKALFRVVEMILSKYQPHMKYVYLTVDNAPGKQQEAVKLQNIYQSYGFSVVDDRDFTILPNSIYMRKPIETQRGGGDLKKKKKNKSFRKNRRRTKRKSVRTRITRKKS